MRWPGLLTTIISSIAPRAAFDIRVLLWLMLPLRRVNLPVPVTLNRRAAPRCVFILGIASSSRVHASGLYDRLRLGGRGLGDHIVRTSSLQRRSHRRLTATVV